MVAVLSHHETRHDQQGKQFKKIFLFEVALAIETFLELVIVQTRPSNYYSHTRPAIKTDPIHARNAAFSNTKLSVLIYGVICFINVILF